MPSGGRPNRVEAQIIGPSSAVATSWPWRVPCASATPVSRSSSTIASRTSSPDSCAAGEAKPQRRQPGGQHVVTALAHLAPVAVLLQPGQQTVAGAMGNVEPVGPRAQRHAFGLAGQVFQQGQPALQGSGHRLRGP